MKKLVLVPVPKQMKPMDGSYAVKPGQLVRLAGAEPSKLVAAGERLVKAMQDEAGIELKLSASPTGPEEEVAVTLRVDETLGHVQGSRLRITPAGVEAAGGSPAGVFYAVTTLAQIVRQCGGRLPGLEIEDAPDFGARGVMLDISRDKVPTIETLLELVDLLASWKINQFQLYTEHTFAYRNHRTVWKDASPMTGDDILRLDRYCRERYIELVPNQASFGHMGRWLKHKEYRVLAEAPDPYVMAGGGKRPGGWDLNPTDPRSIELIGGLYDELFPHFTSRMVNVGCDETWDLGNGKSKEECARKGVGRVYLEFLFKIYEAVKKRGHTMQFWGDIILQHPELVPELPRDLIALEWGYSAEHDFDGRCAKFAASGVPFYVCPGTSTWLSMVGRTETMKANLRNAAVNGMRHGAIGFLNTDWGDNGHWQCLPVSYAGYAYGAAASWSWAGLEGLDLAKALDLFAFRDRAGVMGKMALEMGNLYLLAPEPEANNSAWSRVLQTPVKESGIVKKVEKAKAAKALAKAKELIARVGKAKMESADAKLIQDEYRHNGRMAAHACRLALAKLEAMEKGGAPKVKGLIPEMKAIIREHRRTWLARNGEGGQRDSAAALEARLKEYGERS